MDTPDTERSVLFDQDFEHALAQISITSRYVLVTGGLGFIGSHTSLELLKAGYNVIIIDDLSNSFQSVFDNIKLLAERYHTAADTKCPSIQLHEIDYRNIPAVRRLLELHKTSSPREQMSTSSIVGVIHFAAYKAVAESIRQPLKYYRNNVSGLIDLLDVLGEFGIKNFTFSSSATVYGTLANKGQRLREEDCVHSPETYVDKNGVQRFAEAGCVGITNPYGSSKWMCEKLLSDVAHSDSEWTITALRYFNPIGCDSSGLLGEDPKGTPSNLLPVVVKVLTGQQDSLKMFGDDWDTEDGSAVRDFIHVSDLAKGHIAALKNASEGRMIGNFRTFNLGTSNGHSVREVVSTMAAVAQKEIKIDIAPRRAGDVGSCVAVADRSTEELLWKTEKSLADACRDICNFLERRTTA